MCFHLVLFVMYRQLRRAYKDEIVRDIMSSREAEDKLDSEFKQLKEDRETLRLIFPTGNSKVSYKRINNRTRDIVCRLFPGCTACEYESIDLECSKDISY